MHEVPTSQFTGKPKAKKLDGRKARRKNFTVVELPPRKAKGSARNFSKGMRADRKPIMGDRLVTAEDAIWLRV